MKNFDIFIRSKKSVIIQILCGLNLFLYGCTMQYNGLCNDCSSKEKDEMIQRLTVLYPVGSKVLSDVGGVSFTIREHTRKMISSFDNIYGVVLERSGAESKFESYYSLVEEYRSETQIIQKAKEIEEELATKRDTINSLKFYSEHFRDTGDGPIILHLHDTFAQEMYIVIQALKDLSIDKRCLIKDYSEEYSDECILARRNAPKTKIKWFNFQKYLPKDSVIKTEQNFLGLYTMYKAVMHFDDYDFVDDDFVQEWAVRKCYLIKEQTKQEEENCSYEEQEFLENIALGKAPKCSVKYSTLYGKFKQKLKNTRYWYQEKEEGDTEQHTKFGAINLCVPDKIGL